MSEHEYEFMVGDRTQVYFTNESRVQFWDAETEKEVLSIDPTDLEIVLVAYNHIMALWARQDAEELVH